MSEELKVESKNKLNKKLLIGVAALIVIALIAALILFVPRAAEAGKVTEQLSLGDKYLSELEYEQAEAAYLAVLKIDPKNADAYLGLAEVYLAQGEYEKAEEILNEALENVSGEFAETLKDKLAEVEIAKQAAWSTPTPALSPTPEPTVTSTPSSTPEPTETSTPSQTPEPTETSTPSPTPEPTVTSTPSPTPEPTATSTPTPTNTPTPEPVAFLPEQLVELKADIPEETEVIYLNEGVILTRKDGLYGAMNYDGKELVPNVYETFWHRPTAEGYFSLGESTRAVIFDAKGNTVYEIEPYYDDDYVDGLVMPEQIFISEGFVTCVYGGEIYGCKLYDIKNKQEIKINYEEHAEYGDSALPYGNNIYGVTAVKMERFM